MEKCQRCLIEFHWVDMISARENRDGDYVYFGISVCQECAEIIVGEWFLSTKKG